MSGSNGEIAAIPTVYKGIKFKSRVEARWAVFFDLCGLRWEYEKEKLDTGYQVYIPDFHVFGRDVYGGTTKTLVEIKGKAPSEAEVSKLQNVSRADAFILVGPPSTSQCVCLFDDGAGRARTDGYIRQCPFCGRISFCRKGDSGICYCERSKSFAAYYRFDPYFPGFRLPQGLEYICFTTSPILLVAKEIASSIPFDSPNFSERLEREAKIIALLFENRQFAWIGDALTLTELRDREDEPVAN